jgi:hypothetical protein
VETKVSSRVMLSKPGIGHVQDNGIVAYVVLVAESSSDNILHICIVAS